MVQIRYLKNNPNDNDLATLLHHSQIGVHQPVKALCRDEYHYTPHANAALVVHHYPGTLEQWTFRSDARNWTRTKDTYQGLSRRGRRVDDSIRPWLHDFCQTHGVEVARQLLDQVGQLPSSSLGS
jgi:hypothetical protein